MNLQGTPGLNSATEKQAEPTERSKLLWEAEKIVNRDRNSVYGNPEDNFLDIAALWTAYKGVPFTTMDVVIMNILIKVARLAKTPGYRDGLVDIAGYAACGADVQRAMTEKKTPEPGSYYEVTLTNDGVLPQMKEGESMPDYYIRLTRWTKERQNSRR